MHKVIVERPRLGSRQRSKKTALRLNAGRVAEAVSAGDDFDSGSSRAPASRHSKSLNEYLAPLERYLHRQIGRPWEKVLGEIRQGIDTRSAIGFHVMQHVPDFVRINTFLNGGAVYHFGRWGASEPVYGLYVHPVTGLLRWSNRKRRVRPQPQEPNFVSVGPALQYEKRQGFWFRVELRLNDPDRLVRAADGTVVRAGAVQGFERRTLVSVKQCDRKATRKIEAGEFGELTHAWWRLADTMRTWYAVLDKETPRSL
jgi:hypothetical protein